MNFKVVLEPNYGLKIPPKNRDFSKIENKKTIRAGPHKPRGFTTFCS